VNVPTTPRDLLQESFIAIERLQAKLDEAERAKREPVAIVGVACRYPGVDGPDALWQVLADGKEVIGQIPKDRWDNDAYYDPDVSAPGKIVTRRAGILAGIDQFDPTYFGISPREAQTLDPQHRLLLETSLEAMEHAGIAPDTLVGSATGVFVGITTHDYGDIVRAGGPETSDVYSGTGSALNAAAGRISFTWGFQGPCVAIDTACSSSLVAIHLAARSLRNGESDLALAGGVNVILLPDPLVMMSRWGMLSPDGRCKTFDAAADGFVRGEGCAMIALKRLRDAQRDGDRVLAIIRGSAIGQDGRSSGLTVPNGPAQEFIIRRALADAGLEPADIDYVEAHGTGTPLGDPIEVEALGTVMRQRPADRPLLIGSVKTNLGHTESASGASGVIKVALSLMNERLPTHLHFKSPNPRIAWESYPVKVVSEETPWLRAARPRRAGVSAFGFSGMNAHVVIEEAPQVPVRHEPHARQWVIPISARDSRALRATAGRHAGDIVSRAEISLVDRAYTMAIGRSHHAFRAAVVTDAPDVLAEALRALETGEPHPALVAGTARGTRPKIAFLFTGQGAQYAGMGKALYDSEPVFREALDRCAALLADKLPHPLLEVLWGEHTSHLDQTAYTQPALFALEYALAALWQSWGVVPSVVLGHSVGELVAVCVADMLSLDDAISLIAERGRLMQALPPGGAMAQIFAPETDVTQVVAAVGGTVTVAAVNGPEQVVVSGAEADVERVMASFAAREVRVQRLVVSHAFHSPLVDPMLENLEHAARHVTYRRPACTVISNLTGAPLRDDKPLDATYWRQHARGAVRFADSVKSAVAAGCDLFIEIGPSPTLASLASQAVPNASATFAHSLRRQRDDLLEIATGIATVYAAGATIDWPAVWRGREGRRVALPTYAFQRERYWMPDVARGARRGPNEHPLLGTRVASPLSTAQFSTDVSAAMPSWIADHVIHGAVLLPGTAYMEIGLAAARALDATDASGAVTIGAVEFHKPLAFDGDAARTLHVAVEPPINGERRFTIGSTARGAEEWHTHATGMVRGRAEAATCEVPSVRAVRQRCAQVCDVAELYKRFDEVGITYGPLFRTAREIRTASAEGLAVGRIEVPAAGTTMLLHPAALDACFHVLGALVVERNPSLEKVYLPIGVDEINVAHSGGGSFWCALRVREAGDDDTVIVADLRLEGDDGATIATLTGLRVREASAETLRRALGRDSIPTSVRALRWESAEGATAPIDGPVALLARDADLIATLAPALEAEGLEVQIVKPEASWTPDASIATIVDCRALGDARTGAADADVWEQTRNAYERLLTLGQRLEQAAWRGALVVVTRGAHAVHAGDDVEPVHTALLALARTIAAERAPGPTRRVDLDLGESVFEPTSLIAAIRLGTTHVELAIRDGVPFAPTLAEVVPLDTAAVGSRATCHIEQRGAIDTMTLVRQPRRAPGFNEVEIEIRAAGVNFRDVLNVLGMYPGDPGQPGSECSGVVVRVGGGSDLRPGDAVVAFASEALGTHATVDQALVLRKPPTISFADAATLPKAFVTAYHALRTVSKLRPGQRVLVHAAAGGVGMAALRLAKLFDAEVIGTAGSPAKRAVVLANGASHAFDSRSTSFADDVLRVTNGEGVDVVLSSLTGEFIDASMRVLKQGGWFIELGKKDIWTAEIAAERAPGKHYRVYDLGESMARDMADVRAHFTEVVDHVAAKRLEPLPWRAFPLRDAAAAFRHMAMAKHVGKIVLVPDGSEAEGLPAVRRDATYLVTGGLGGLGLAVADYLAARGAGAIVLTSRRAADPDQAARIAEMVARGTRVRVASADVADATAVRALRAELEGTLPPLRGIVHAAGVVADAPLASQDLAAFERVAAAKVRGAWNLHETFAEAPLDFLISFSSMSALNGSAGQANYAAANGFLDGFAAWRRARALRATSIAWGAWDEIGMAGRMSDAIRRRWAERGAGMMSPRSALDGMARTLCSGSAYAVVAAIDWRRAAAAPDAAWTRALVGVTDPESGARSVVTLNVAALPFLEADARDNAISEWLRQCAAQVLGFRPQLLEPGTPLVALGLDSLMAVQLRNRIEGEIGLRIEMARFFEGASVATLVPTIAASLVAPEGLVPAGVSADDGTSQGWEEGTL
jgi:acyl transferase domain-containing protein/NADPH:quinone reductase-like Zn-dependent oxidoreductase/acyl carrier protein